MSRNRVQNMTNERLSPDAVKRVSGPAWSALKPLFFQISDILLDVNGDCFGELTTIYVKYQVSTIPSSAVFAVVWLKNSAQIVLGLALPDSVDSPLLGPAPKGMTYRGLTKYFTLKAGDSVPSELSTWAGVAYGVAKTQE